jgi:hypothetical protein
MSIYKISFKNFKRNSNQDHFIGHLIINEENKDKKKYSFKAPSLWYSPNLPGNLEDLPTV